MDKPAAMAGGSTHWEMSPMATKVLPWCCSMVGTQMRFRRSQVRYRQLRQGGTWWLTVPHSQHSQDREGGSSPALNTPSRQDRAPEPQWLLLPSVQCQPGSTPGTLTCTLGTGVIGLLAPAKAWSGVCPTAMAPCYRACPWGRWAWAAVGAKAGQLLPQNPDSG